MSVTRNVFTLAIVGLAAAALCRAQLPLPDAPVGLKPGNPPQLLWDQCGGEGERACSLSDPSFLYLPQKLPGFACDRALDVAPLFPSVSGVPFRCVDLGGRSKPAIRARLSPISRSQQNDQYGSISADLPINLIPILGTHNSYSNAVDGSESWFSKNQEHSITDQLWLGARHIRMDPMNHPTRQFLCHMSPDTQNNGFFNFLRSINPDIPTTEVGLCGVSVAGIAPGGFRGRISYLRPFYMALREFRRWLERNPGEVVFLLINNFWEESNSAYSSPAELELVIRHELEPLLYWRNGANTWPTLRQIRSEGKQVIVTMANVTGISGAAWPVGLGGRALSHSTNNAGFYVCRANPSRAEPLGTQAIGIDDDHNHLTPESIGEGRTIADKFTGLALIGNGEMDIAVYCGFNRIGLDYFYALNKAPSSPFAGVTDFTDGVNDDCTVCDDRPRRIVWSWRDAEFPAAGRPVALLSVFPPVNNGLPPSLTEVSTYRWTQNVPSGGLPYACASLANPSQPFPNPDNPWNYQWTITANSGPWQNGEAACQQLGPNYHFWRPMSSPENQRLISAMKVTGIRQVWINHLPGQTSALAGMPNATFDAASDFQENVVVSSGFGGKITTSFVGGGANFLTVTQSKPGSNLFTIAKTNPLPTLPNGVYNATVRFTEERPDGQGAGTSDVFVTMRVGDTASLRATPAAVNFVSGLTQQVDITSSDPSSGQIAFRLVPLTETWITASLNQTTTPARLTLTLNPALAPPAASLRARLEGAGGNSSSVEVPVSAILVRASVQTTPVPIPMQIDGAQTTTPLTRSWVAGSTHQLDALSSYETGNTLYTFEGWTGSSGVTTPSRTVAPSTDTAYVARYAVRHRLTLSASPANGGTVAVQNPSQDGTYPEGGTVTITATPAQGYAFRQFTGASVSQQSPVTLAMNAPKSVQALFVQAQAATRFETVPPGLPILVDGVAYATPASFPWPPGESHSVSAPDTQPGRDFTRYAFARWGDNLITNPRTFSGSATEVTHTVFFKTQLRVSATVSPAAAGTVTGAGWYDAGSTAQLRATPAAGFQFESFAGFTGNPVNLTVNAPVDTMANFTALGRPTLYASSSGRTDLGGGNVAVPIVLSNLGSGPAGDAVITAIEGFQVPQGGGAVSVTLPPGGIAIGTILPRGKASAIVNFSWSPTATRVTFTVRYTANGGTYSGANTITLFR